MRRLVMFLFLVLIIGLLSGCSGQSSSVPEVTEVGSDVAREGQTTSLDIIYRFHDWGDPTDGVISALDAWVYWNEYLDRTELVCPKTGDPGQVDIWSESSGSWVYVDSLDVDADTGGSSDDCLIVGVTGAQSNSASHTRARLLVYYYDISSSSIKIAVYAGSDDAYVWGAYKFTWELDYNDGTTDYSGAGTLDIDLSPDASYMVVAFYWDHDFMAMVWDIVPAGSTASDFFEDSDGWEWAVKIYDNDEYGPTAQVAMGAYDFNLYDHSFAYSIPGAGIIRLYYQGSDDQTWTYQNVLSFASWDVDISCDAGTDYLFCWSQQYQEAKFYTLDGSAIATSRDTFAQFGLRDSAGGINGLAWIAAGCVNLYGDDYIEVFLGCSIDLWVEGFGNFT